MVLSMKRWTAALGLFCALVPLFSQTIFEEGKYPNAARVLRANQLSDKKSILLAWEPPKEEGEVIIARSNSIIDSPDKLYVADSLGRYKSGGNSGTRTYYDYNLKPGTYYYAVVLVSDVRKREVRLFPNQNYTVVPVTIDEGGAVVSDNPAFPAFPEETKVSSGKIGFISDLKATLERKNVRLDWNPPSGAVSGRTVYTVYRSASPLTSLPLMQKAQKLAELSHPTMTFLDQGLDKSQTLYYGVSVKDLDGEESLPLEDKKSTLRVFYIRDYGKNHAEMIPDDSVPASTNTKINNTVTVPEDRPGTMHVRGVGYERVGKGVVISWLPPEAADDSTVYSVYASTKPLNQGPSSFGSGTVVKVASVNHPKTNFYIKELKEIDELYFGVTVKSGTIPEDYQLKEQVSYFRLDFSKDMAVPEATVSSVTEDKPKEENKTNVPPITNEHGVTPTEIHPGSEMTEWVHDTRSPNGHTTVDYDLADTDLNRIIKSTVLKKKFELAVDHLEKYISRQKNSHLLGKAYFYLGISYLKTDEPKKALRYFMKRETKSFSPERSEFWTNQTLEKLGRGRS